MEEQSTTRNVAVYMVARKGGSSDSERMSPTPIYRPRYINRQRPTFRRCVKSEIDEEVMCICTHRVDRGNWGERVLKGYSMSWEVHTGVLSVWVRIEQ